MVIFSLVSITRHTDVNIGKNTRNSDIGTKLSELQRRVGRGDYLRGGNVAQFSKDEWEKGIGNGDRNQG